jgi:AraC-like DNA-binding protein
LWDIDRIFQLVYPNYKNDGKRRKKARLYEKVWRIAKVFWQFPKVAVNAHAVRPWKECVMDSLVEMFFLSRMSTDGDILDAAKITGEDGRLKLLPRRAYAEGSYLVKQAGKSLLVSEANLCIRQPIKHTVKDTFDYFCIGLCRGSIRGIGGMYIEKGKTYTQNLPAGFAHCAVELSFLPEFFDTLLNSRHGVSPDEISRAINALGKLPLIPNAAVILKQIGEASFIGDAGNIWIEAKALELVSVILDWHRKLERAGDALNEWDRAGIAAAMRYAEEHFSGPLALTALARQAAMGMSKFTAVFKTHTGLSAAAYIHRLRMDKALDLVKNTSCPLAEVAGAAGYKHYTSFSTAFCEQFGVAPSAFRKRESTKGK